jgi:hypothetical protein
VPIGFMTSDSRAKARRTQGRNRHFCAAIHQLRARIQSSPTFIGGISDAPSHLNARESLGPARPILWKNPASREGSYFSCALSDFPYSRYEGVAIRR